MDREESIELQILEEIENKGSFTQRDLAQKLKIALGLSNAYIRRLVEKGYVMVSTMPKKRVFYNLTPKGIFEKSRLTLLFMKDSLSYYKSLRGAIESTVQTLKKQGAKRIVILGAGEIAEIVFLSLKQAEMELMAVVQIKPQSSNFLGIEVFGVDRLKTDDFDAIIVAEEVFGDTLPLAELVNEHQLSVEKMVMFSGHKLKKVTEVKIDQSITSETPTENKD